MKVQAKHGKVTQNMHGASRNYRYVWDVSISKWPNPFEQRISLGTKLIKAKAFSRTHGRGSQVDFHHIPSSTMFCVDKCCVGGPMLAHHLD